MCPCPPEVAGHIQALMIAIEHVHSSALKLSLLVQFPQKHDNTCILTLLQQIDLYACSHAASGEGATWQYCINGV